MTVRLAVCCVIVLLAMSVNSLLADAQTVPPFQPIERFSIENFVASKRDVGKVKHVDPIDKIFETSRWYLRGATAIDATTTAIGMEFDHGIETGWGRCFGPRNTSAVVAWNVGLSLGTEYLSKVIYQKGGKWRYAAAGMNLLKGSGNLAAGIHNAHYIAAH